MSESIMADCIPHRIFCDHLSRYPHCHQTHSVTGNPVECALVHYGDEFLKHDNLHGGNLLILKTLLKIEHVVQRRQQQLKARTHVIREFRRLPPCVDFDSLQSTGLTDTPHTSLVGFPLVAGMETSK